MPTCTAKKAIRATPRTGTTGRARCDEPSALIGRAEVLFALETGLRIDGIAQTRAELLLIAIGGGDLGGAKEPPIVLGKGLSEGGRDNKRHG